MSVAAVSGRTLLSALLGLVSLSTAGRTQETIAIRGHVSDVNGARLSQALVEVVGTFWRASSRADGGFELAVPRGAWKLRVRRLGFRPETLSVQAPNDSVVVRLRLATTELKGVSVTGVRTPPLGETVTTATVRQVPPLGEPDLFRAATLLPAISQPNDLKGRIHLAGGASDETAVRLDGHPLQDPFHLLGVLGAFNIAALERGDVLIHHVPASTGGGLSGLINLESRRADSAGRTEAVIGLLSSGLTTSRRLSRRGADLLVSGRITYLDRLVDALGGRIGLATELPLLGYYDALVRVGVPATSRTFVDAIAFTTRDNSRASGGSSPGTAPLSWGESMVGLVLRRDLGDWQASARTSFNRASERFDAPRSLNDTARARIRLDRDWASAALKVTRLARSWTGTVGAELDAKRTQHDWSAVPKVFTPRTPHTFRGSDDLTLPTLFGEVTRSGPLAGTIEMGLRATAAKGHTFVGPRFLISIVPRADWLVEAGVNRRHQFDTQLEEPEEGSALQPIFFLRAPRMADVGALSVSWADREAAGRRVRLTGFAKRYQARAYLRGNPRAQQDSGGRLPAGFPEFDRIPGRSFGAALGGTYTFSERTLLQASYTSQRVEEKVDGSNSPTAWDAPHALSAFVSLPLSGSWTLNGVYQARSGAATTPVGARIFAPHPSFPSPLELRSRYLLADRNSARLPGYSRLDLGLRREWKSKHADWALSLQVLNALGRKNPSMYNWGAYFCVQAGECREMIASRNGLPRVPSLGLEVRW